jgi:pimeloyl-ACP methyl ester carboxylesterase
MDGLIMDLFFREYGQGSPLLILHGLFGNADNWATLGRKFGEHYSTFTPDLRNHGQSPHIAEMDYPSMSRDVHYFMESQWLHQAYVMGHSMGGKVAMQLAMEYPDSVEKLIVVDMATRSYAGGHETLFEAMEALPLDELENRKEAEAFLGALISDAGVLQFLLKNLIYDKNLNGYRWRINLPIIREAYPHILGPLPAKGIFEKPTLFIYGGRSNYLTEADKPIILQQFPNAAFQEIPDAGHWVHAERPAELFEAVVNFLGA